MVAAFCGVGGIGPTSPQQITGGKQELRLPALRAIVSPSVLSGFLKTLVCGFLIAALKQTASIVQA